MIPAHPLVTPPWMRAGSSGPTADHDYRTSLSQAVNYVVSLYVVSLYVVSLYVVSLIVLSAVWYIRIDLHYRWPSSSDTPK
jgi:hypothetical protein